MTKPSLLAATALAMLLPAFVAVSAQAQMGSVNNPPPQHLFDMGQPKRLDNGLGTMATPRSALAPVPSRKAAKTARNPVPLPR